MLAALIRLFTSFINCAWPGRSPTSNTFRPIRASSGRISSSAARGPAAITDSVPARAPFGPPLIGQSTSVMPRTASDCAMRAIAALPMVDIST